METLVSVILGVVCVVIGISHRKGNLSLLHSYHRKRVAPRDTLPFGKLVGLGTIVIGVALILMGGLQFLSSYCQAPICETIANVIFTVGLVVGLGISFYAMFKYNKGIF